MFFKQFFLGCLAHASYMIGSEKEACVVDPQRDVDQYIEEAERNGLAIKYIIETHLHADFVSGHKELAERTGARIVFSHKAKPQFEHEAVKDNDVLTIGTISLKILETPGHTPESICILVTDRANSGEPAKILTGDTLFIGDVGRPDLVGKQGITSEEMAACMYDSLHGKLLTLDDSVEVYPAHGAGSLCGKNMSTERSSTIGVQRKFNYALQKMTKDEFVAMMCENLPDAPKYFFEAVKKNKKGALALDALPEPKPVSPDQLAEEIARQKQPPVVLDVRDAARYGAAHLPGSINIGLSGQFATWTGSLINMDTELILVADRQEEIEEAVIRLARAGHESVSSYLDGGVDAWRESGREVASTPQISVDELNQLSGEKKVQVIDVRRVQEFKDGHVPGATNIPLIELGEHLDRIGTERPVAVVCRSGYRSSVATSILESRGLKDLINVVGGTVAWIEAGHVKVVETGASPACTAS